MITGAASGIGRATAVTFAELGAQLALLDINGKGLETVAKEIGKKGVRCEWYETDLADTVSVDKSFDLIHSDFGRVDILANVAGTAESIPFLEMKRADLERIMAINFTGAFNCIRRVLSGMVERRYGKIISVASVVGKVGAGLVSSHYAASKGALLALTYSLARAYGAYSININAVTPGFIDTPLSRTRWDMAVREYVDKSDLKRPGRPEEVAAVIAFLASDASSFVSGQAWNVCGGYLKG